VYVERNPTFRRNITSPTLESQSKPRKKISEVERGQVSLTFASADFLLVLIFDSEDGGDMYLRNVRIPLSYVELQARRPYSP
jgi:hypothetical protein